MKLTQLLLYLLLLTIPLGQLGRLPLGGENVNLYLPDVLIPLTIFIWLGYALGIRKELELPPLTNLILLFSFVALISLINGKKELTTGEFLVSAMYWVRWLMYAGIYFVVWDVGGGVKGVKDDVTRLLIFSGVALALAGFLQLIILPDFTKLDPSLGWDPHKSRLASTFLDPNFAGAYLVLTLSLIFSRVLYKGVRGMKGIKDIILGALVFAALILTFSRSAWLMFAVSMGVMGVLKSRKLLVLALIAFLAAYAVVPRVQTRVAGGVDPDDSASARIVSWRGTLEIVKDTPLLGVGFNAFRYAQSRYGFFGFTEPLGGRAGAGSDSSLLLVLATTGVSGLAAFLLLGFRGFWGIWGVFLNKNSPPSGRALSLAFLAGAAGLVVESSFINSLFYPWVMIWVWTVLALASARVQS